MATIATAGVSGTGHIVRFNAFARRHPTIVIGAGAALLSAFLPHDLLIELVSIGTLAAFVIVCVSVMVLRRTAPNAPRPFRTPFVPAVPIGGIIVCGAMIYGLGWTNWLRLIGWLAIGMVIYFGYSQKHSLLNKG